MAAYHRRIPEIADNRAIDGFCPRTLDRVTSTFKFMTKPFVSVHELRVIDSSRSHQLQSPSQGKQ